MNVKMITGIALTAFIIGGILGFSLDNFLALQIEKPKGINAVPLDYPTTIGESIQSISDRWVQTDTLRFEGQIAALEGMIIDPTWKPQRYFGPFKSGSDFGEIQILFEGNSGNWYHNNFFDQHPDRSIFVEYYASPFPDPDPTPSQTHTPGIFPNLNGANDVLFALRAIHYTSKYGGSVRLDFSMVEDIEFEMREGDTVWDIGTFETSIYVCPVASKINQAVYHTTAGFKPIHIEFVAEDVIAYDTNAQVLPDTQTAVLTEALNNLANSVALGGYPYSKKILYNSNWFVHAFIHSQFQDMLGVREIVDMIVLSDDFIDIFTHTGEPVCRVTFKVDNLYVRTETSYIFETTEELLIWAEISHEYKDGRSVRGPSDYYERERERGAGGVDTPWLHAGTWTLPELAELEQIVYTVTVVEEDLIWDDPQGTHENIHQLDHSEIELHAANNEFGVISETGRYVELIDGDYRYRCRVYLLLR